MARITINGTARDVDADPETPLLWVIREQLGLTGTKYGCGVAQCGACTVLVDGQATRSCVTTVDSVVGMAITTIEAIEQDPEGRKVVEAWVANQVPQCGYCQSGLIMAVAALLDRNPHPTDAEIDAAITNICRCGTYPRIREAIAEGDADEAELFAAQHIRRVRRYMNLET